MPGISAADSHASSCWAESAFSCSVSSRAFVVARMPSATARVASVSMPKRSTIAFSVAPVRSMRCTSFDIDESRVSWSSTGVSFGNPRRALTPSAKAA
jgi:hypothetical protein